MRILLLGNPEGMRARLFAAAAARCRPAISVKVLAWEEFLTVGGAEKLDHALSHADVLRLDSPGKNWAVEKALLGRGCQLMRQNWRDEPFRCLPARKLSLAKEDPGRIWPMRQWYLGFSEALQEVETVQARWANQVRWMNSPAAIRQMFDKWACHEIFEQSGVPTPKLIGAAEYDGLLAYARKHPSGRVFVKPCHGSSASGVIAWEWSPRGAQAFTTLEIQHGEEVKLYNRREVRRLSDPWGLLEYIAAERALMESWFPKASFAGRIMDLRVVVIAGKAEHVVLRLAKGPITNLQLGAERGDVAALRAAMGETRWARAMGAAELAAAQFPGALYVGVDLMLSPGWNRPAVAEVNAFGDLLPEVPHRGTDTYGLELQALQA